MQRLKVKAEIQSLAENEQVNSFHFIKEKQNKDATQINKLKENETNALLTSTTGSRNSKSNTVGSGKQITWKRRSKL